MNRLYPAVGDITQRASPALRLALKAVLVGIVCHLSIQLGHAFKFPPHDISALWPASAILVSILMASPVRHWWVYLLAGYSTYAIDVARFGFLVSDVLYNVADIIKVVIASVGVRWFAGGLRAFDSLRGLVLYLAFAVVLAPMTSAFVAALAGAGQGYWFYWRAWYMSETLAFLVLAPAILTWIAAARAARGGVSFARFLEAGVLASGLIAISLVVFHGPAPAEKGSIPVLVYLPLPFLLWTAVRFGPAGANTALLAVAFLAISGVLQGRGPFAARSLAEPTENVLPLQLFLIMLSLPLMFLATLVAERRERANALRESEARFRSMADTAPVLVWMSGRDKLCSFFNKTWLDFTGKTLEKELGYGWSEGLHPSDRERCLATYGNAFDARREFTMEYRFRRHDGEYRWILDKGVPRVAPDGTFVGYIGCAHDISERKLAELDAQRHRADIADALAFERLVADVLATLLVADPREEDHVINQGLRDIARHLEIEAAALWERVPDRIGFGTTHRWLADSLPPPPDQLGPSDLPWISARLLSRSVVRFSRYSDLPDEAAEDVVVLRRLGIRALLAIPFSTSGTVAGVLSFATAREEYTWPDGLLPRVTILAEVFAGVRARWAAERRERVAQTETAQLRERLAHLVRVHTMGEMSAAIAHEINQPLMAITNYTQAAHRRLAEGTIDSGRISELLSKVAAQSARAGDVVKRISAMVKRQDSEARELDVARLIGNSIRLVEYELELHDVRIELRVAPGLPPVRAEEIQLQQVMLNLMRNAMDAMEAIPASENKTLSIDAMVNEDQEVEVRVRDRGPGIASSDAERVFEPFYTTKASGLGIGLAICRKIVEAHGGRLWLASSESPGGTVFQFTLPAAESGAAE